MPDTPAYRAHVAIVGGATAGAEAAEKLAAEGALCVVFEQNDRPYGKVEDGLPAWHVALRKKEYETIDAKLQAEGVHYVPCTGIGRDLSFDELLKEWGFDLIVLANGAWRDRPLPVAGADAYINRGLIYQNPFIYWFNHHREPGYRGPSYELHGGAIVVGGGLASLDVVKVIQLEMTCRALAERGIEQDFVEMEVHGIPATLEKHGLQWDELGIEPCTLYYRRRIEDMPLSEAKPSADAEQMQRTGAIRRRILEKAQGKFLFHVEPQWTPIGLLTDGDRLEGLRFAKTRVNEAGRAVVAHPGETREVRSRLVISSIGSIPEPIEGLPMDGELLRIDDVEHGKVTSFDNVFGCGNVVTGKGNLVASRRHSSKVAKFLVGRLESEATQRARRTGSQLEELIGRIRERQSEVGYGGDYRRWITRFVPQK